MTDTAPPVDTADAWAGVLAAMWETALASEDPAKYRDRVREVLSEFYAWRETRVAA